MADAVYSIYPNSRRLGRMLEGSAAAGVGHGGEIVSIALRCPCRSNSAAIRRRSTITTNGWSAPC